VATSSDSRAAITVAAENVGLADPGHRVAHGVLGLRSVAQVLPDAEHQEQAVVRARAEDQHDQEQLSELGDLEARVRRLADQRPGDGDRQERGEQRDQRPRACTATTVFTEPRSCCKVDSQVASAVLRVPGLTLATTGTGTRFADSNGVAS
jgi:hypothetical protein